MGASVPEGLLIVPALLPQLSSTNACVRKGSSPCSYPSSVVHCLLLGAGLLGGAGGVVGSSSLVSVLGSPLLLCIGAGTLSAFPRCSPEKGVSVLSLVRRQFSAPLPVVVKFCFYWCRLLSPRGSSTPWGSRSSPGRRDRWILLLPLLQWTYEKEGLLLFPQGLKAFASI